MEKVNRNQSIVKNFLSDLYQRRAKAIPGIAFQLILDDERGQYLLYKNGWRGQHRIYGCVAHIEVKPDGKVWLHHDGTDLAIGQVLIDLGINKKDLVIGFHAPVMRADTEFAVA